MELETEEKLDVQYRNAEGQTVVAEMAVVILPKKERGIGRHVRLEGGERSRRRNN